MKKSINTAILGYGKSAKHFHIPLISASDEFKLVTILQGSKNDARLDFPELDIAGNLDDILCNPEIDFVIVGTPNHLHFEQAERCLRAGKHVMVEKPFTITTDEADRLIEIAEEVNRCLTVFQSKRWDSDYITVKKLIESGKIGKLLEFENNYPRFRQLYAHEVWKETSIPGAGVFYDLSPHLIDQALQLFGMPKSLYADIRRQRGGEAEDWFEIHLYYDELRVTLRAGMMVSDPLPSYVLRGDAGSFVKFHMDSQEEKLAAGEDPSAGDWGIEPESRYGTFYTMGEGGRKEEKIETMRGDYPGFYRELGKALLQGTPPPVLAAEARDVMYIIEKSVESNIGKTAAVL
ncbi:MAG: oxidoreductase [Balneolaceae bacterium]|nr:MAG: oxidoreductase [Balneolaceae bacterium]